MNTWALLLLWAITLAGCQSFPSLNSWDSHVVRDSPKHYQVGFSPKGDGERLIINAIQDAKKSIELAAYSFTSEPVASALILAHQRGVALRVVVDRGSNLRQLHSRWKELHHNGVPIRLNGRYAIFHHKFMVIDGKHLQTGSFNYSANAQLRNAENVLLLFQVPDIAKQYREEFNRLWAKSQSAESLLDSSAPRSRQLVH